MPKVTRSDTCKWCSRRFSDVDGGVASCIRKQELALECKACGANIRSRPLEFKTAEDKKRMETKLSEDLDVKKEWMLQVAGIERRWCTRLAKSHESSKKRSHGELGAELDQMDQEFDQIQDVAADKESINTKRTRKISGQKDMGVFWPLKKLREKFKGQGKPKAKRVCHYDGERGAVLDSEHGCPTGCTRLFETVSDGIEKKKVVVSSKDLRNVEDIQTLWDEIEGQRALKLMKAAKLSNHEDAPIAFAMAKRDAPSLPEGNCKGFFQEMWGGSLFTKCDRNSIVEEWSKDEFDDDGGEGSAMRAALSSTSSDGEKVTKRELSMRLATSVCDDIAEFFARTLSSRSELLKLTKNETDKFVAGLKPYLKDYIPRLWSNTKLEDACQQEGKDLMDRVTKLGHQLEFSALLCDFVDESVKPIDPEVDYSYTPKSCNLTQESLRNAGVVVDASLLLEIGLRRQCLGSVYSKDNDWPACFQTLRVDWQFGASESEDRFSLGLFPEERRPVIQKEVFLYLTAHMLEMVDGISTLSCFMAELKACVPASCFRDEQVSDVVDLKKKLQLHLHHKCLFCNVYSTIISLTIGKPLAVTSLQN